MLDVDVSVSFEKHVFALACFCIEEPENLHSVHLQGWGGDLYVNGLNCVDPKHAVE